jgi:hypothetical protein
MKKIKVKLNRAKILKMVVKPSMFSPYQYTAFPSGGYWAVTLEDPKLGKFHLQSTAKFLDDLNIGDEVNGSIYFTGTADGKTPTTEAELVSAFKWAKLVRGKSGILEKVS